MWEYVRFRAQIVLRYTIYIDFDVFNHGVASFENFVHEKNILLIKKFY